MKEQSQVWKVLAIVFISLFIIETILFAWIWNLGIKTIKQEDKCSTMCSTDERYGVYAYDSYSDICYCVTPEGEYILQGGN